MTENPTDNTTVDPDAEDLSGVEPGEHVGPEGDSQDSDEPIEEPGADGE